MHETILPAQQAPDHGRLNRSFPRRLTRWHYASGALALLVAAPLIVVFSGWLQPETEIWAHLADTILSQLVLNTIKLVFGVGLGVILLGVSLAWLTARCEFPGRRWFDWLLMLPMAMPAYVLAFVAIGLFDFSGPVQTSLRTWTGTQVSWFPEIRSTGGLVTVMVMAFYPYVYMMARTAFITQGKSTLEAARMLGSSSYGAFWRVALPMARPAIAAGTTLALMETLADFGTVATFNYDTFTTAIYKAWFGFFSLQAASQLASILLLLVFVGLMLEKASRNRGRYHDTLRSGEPPRIRLTGLRGWSTSVALGLVFFIAFLLPFIQLCLWSFQVITTDFDERYFGLLWHTLLLGSLAAIITVVAGLLLSFARRFQPDRTTRTTSTLATLGYALPGSVLAVGIMIAASSFDNGINNLLQSYGLDSVGQVLGGSLLALVLAYVIRFMAVAFGPIETALSRIRPSVPEAARSLGASSTQTLRAIYLPLLRPGLMTALLLVMVDTMKEMPATLLMRPFGWDTLAVRIYEMTSEGEWERAALPAITLVFTGLIPVILLMRRSVKRRN
jgi:iron(III) transport system permease protein